MKIRSVLPFAASLSVLLAVACSSSTSGPQPTMCFGANVTANEVNDYTFRSTMSLPPVTVKSKSNLTFEWGGLTKDFLKHPLTPGTDINTVSVLIWQLTLPQ